MSLTELFGSSSKCNEIDITDKFINCNFKGSRSTSASSSFSSVDQKELSCGGQPCSKCGACRDWYQCRKSDDIVKRHDANCNREYMYRHDLVSRPERDYCDNAYFPLQSLTCMCRDNY